jgi:hypothetical protein
VARVRLATTVARARLATTVVRVLAGDNRGRVRLLPLHRELRSSGNRPVVRCQKARQEGNERWEEGKKGRGLKTKGGDAGSDWKSRGGKKHGRTTSMPPGSDRAGGA